MDGIRRFDWLLSGRQDDFENSDSCDTHALHHLDVHPTRGYDFITAFFIILPIIIGINKCPMACGRGTLINQYNSAQSIHAKSDESGPGAIAAMIRRASDSYRVPHSRRALRWQHSCRMSSTRTTLLILRP